MNPGEMTQAMLNDLSEQVIKKQWDFIYSKMESEGYDLGYVKAHKTDFIVVHPGVDDSPLSRRTNCLVDAIKGEIVFWYEDWSIIVNPPYGRMSEFRAEYRVINPGPVPEATKCLVMECAMTARKRAMQGSEGSGPVDAIGPL